jgi:hypothetical protein
MNKSPTVVLHIGPHKTGTTYIQKNLLNNRTALAQAGVVYPDVFRTPLSPGHNDINRAITEDPQGSHVALTALVDDLQAKGQTAVLSAENMSLMNDTAIAALRRGLEPLPVHVVVYLRARGPAIWSQWQEHIKFGQTYSLHDYVMGLLLSTPDDNVVDPLGLALRWRRIFGLVTLVDYDGCVAEGRDLIDPLLQVVNGGTMVLPSMNTDKVNIRMLQERVEILRMLNLVWRRRLQRHPKNHVRKVFLDQLRERSKVQDVTASLGALIRPRLVKLPLARLDGYFASRDDAHIFALQSMSVAVPPFAARRPAPDPDTLAFEYLPDSDFLFTQILPAVIELYGMLDIDERQFPQHSPYDPADLCKTTLPNCLYC